MESTVKVGLRRTGAVAAQFFLFVVALGGFKALRNHFGLEMDYSDATVLCWVVIWLGLPVLAVREGRKLMALLSFGLIFVLMILRGSAADLRISQGIVDAGCATGIVVLTFWLLKPHRGQATKGLWPRTIRQVLIVVGVLFLIIILEVVVPVAMRTKVR